MLLVFIEPMEPNTMPHVMTLRHVEKSANGPDYEARDRVMVFIAKWSETMLNRDMAWLVEVVKVNDSGAFQQVGVGRLRRPAPNQPVDAVMTWEPMFNWHPDPGPEAG